MSRLCGKLYCMSCVRLVSSEKQYNCVILYASFNMLSVDGRNVQWLLLLLLLGFFSGKTVIYL